MKAGNIARKALERGKEVCEVGVNYLDVAEEVEKVIWDNGAKPAFPTNISVNNIGAHYTPVENEGQTFEKGDVVKIDIGCHVDGYIADNALTVELGTNRYTSLIEAAEESLEFAIKSMRPGMKIRDVGRNIETVITSKGYNPISNLTGHELEQYSLHAGTAIPNVTRGFGKIKEGMVLAIEPFATDGVGKVRDKEPGEIYKLEKKRRLKGEDLEFYNWIEERFDHLPFAARWCKEYSDDYKDLLDRQKRFSTVLNYPVLEERKNGIISQREHTVIVTSSGAEITTKL